MISLSSLIVKDQELKGEAVGHSGDRTGWEDVQLSASQSSRYICRYMNDHPTSHMSDDINSNLGNMVVSDWATPPPRFSGEPRRIPES